MNGYHFSSLRMRTTCSSILELDTSFMRTELWYGARLIIYFEVRPLPGISTCKWA